MRWSDNQKRPPIQVWYNARRLNSYQGVRNLRKQNFRRLQNRYRIKLRPTDWFVDNLLVSQDTIDSAKVEARLS